MKLLLGILLIGISFLTAQNQETIPKQKFNDYADKFQKSYISIEDREKRYLKKYISSNII